MKPTVEFDPPLLHTIARRALDNLAALYADAPHPPAFVSHARPYLDAMLTLDTCHDNYFADSGDTIVMYALSNLTQWRGEMARVTKKQLREHLKLFREKKAARALFF